MTEFDQDDVKAKNDESLRMLARSLTLSQGQFSLILARCNYRSLRQRLMQQLRERCPVEFRERLLDPSAKTIETTIQQELRDEPPPAVIISGLESVRDLDAVLLATNQARDEFRKNFPFPLVLWGTDEVLRRLIRVAPDFESWAATPIEFEIATDELIHFIQETADEVFAKVLEAGAGIFLDNAALNLGTGSPRRAELESARHELQSRGVKLDPELEASLEFVLGRDADVSVEQSRQHYERSLALWQNSPNLERRGCVLYSLGIWWRTYAKRHRAEYEQACGREKDYFQQCVEAFEQANRKDLAAKFINPLGAILQDLQQWDELEVVAKKALTLHQTYPDRFRLARAYGFLAEVHLAKFAWIEAKHLAEQALSILASAELTASNSVSSEQSANLEWVRSYHQGWYLFSLARSQQGLGHTQEAIATLETATAETKPYYDPELYIRILEEMRSLYFEQGNYLKAFEIKLEQRSIEQQYGFRAFVGPGRLQPKQQVINPVLAPVEAQRTLTQEITVSGRQQDVNRLVERIGRNDHKLTVIQGQSGVGKSSILQAGLIPALKQKAIGTRDVIPILQQVYTDWIRELGKHLAEALVESGNFASDLTPQPPSHPSRSPLQGEMADDEAFCSRKGESGSPLLVGDRSFSEELGERSILDQLRKNSENNLLTVLIFDQFEEFFFVCKDLSQRRPFYEFLRECLDIPYVKVILSLREDYLYYLLECNNRFVSLEVINNNILDKNILYYLGNFSGEDAKSVIQSLTEQTQFSLEPALINALVQDLAGELGEVRPIELQVVGAQLQTEKITKLEQYREHGPKEKLVGRFLEEVVKDCGPENELTAKLVLYLLTDENNTRPLKTRGDLELELDVTAEKLDLVLEIFVKSRLVFQVPALPVDRYQLVHDYLVAFVRQEQSARLIAELEKEREQRKLTEARLNQVLKQQLRRSGRRATIALAGLLAAIGGFAIIATVVGINLYLTNLSTASAQNKDKPFERVVSALKAAKNLKRFSSVAIDGTKLKILAELNQAVSLVTESNRLEGFKSAVKQINFSPDSKMIATVSEDDTAQLWSIDGSEIPFDKRQKVTATSTSFSPSFSPDGKLLATAGKDGKVILWHIDNRKITYWKTLPAHTDSVTNVSFSPNGKMLATAGEDKTVKIWSIDGTQIGSIKKGLSDRVTTLSFSPDGKMLATGSQFDAVKFWNLKGKNIGSIDNYQAMIIRFSSDGKTITLVNKDGTVKLWKIDSFNGNCKGILVKNSNSRCNFNTVSLNQNRTWLAYNPTYNNKPIYIDNLENVDCSSPKELSSDSITYLSFSPDAKWLASASKDKTVQLWSVNKVLNLPEKGKSRVTRVKYSPDDKTIAIGHADNTVELRQHDGTKSIPFPADSSIFSFSPDGKTLATGSIEDVVTLLRPDGREVLLKGHINNIQSLNFSPDGQLIVVVSGDNKVELWRPDGTFFKRLTGCTNNITSIKFSPDNQIIAAICADNVMLWHRDGSLIKTLPTPTKEVNDLVFSPNSQFIASFGNYNQVDLWRRDGSFIKTLKGHTDRVTSVSFSPDSQTIASVSSGYGRPENSEIRLWRSKDGSEIKTIENYGIQKVSFSPNGKIIASINADNTVKLWSLEGNPLATLKHNNQINSLSFSPNSKMVATASDDSTVKLGISNDGTFNDRTLTRKDFRGHTNAVTSVSFSPDGKTLASASNDNTVRLWSSDGSLIKSLPEQSDGDKTDNVDNHLVSFSRDGKLITSVSGGWSSFSRLPYRSNYTVKLWRRSDGKLVNSLTGHSDYGSVNSGNDWSVAFKNVSFSTNGKLVAIASRNHAINLWHLDGTLQATLTGNNNWVNSVSFSPEDGKTIASASDDGTIKLWSSSDGKFLKLIGKHSDKVNSVSFDPDGKIIASASDDKTVKLWNSNGTPYQPLPSIHKHNEKVTSVRFSPDRKTLAYASDSGTVRLRLWSSSGKNDKELPKLDNSGSNSEIDALNFSPDGKMLSLGGSRVSSGLSGAQLYIPNGFWFKATQLFNTTGLSDGLSDVNFSPSSQSITVTSNNGNLLLSPSLDELMRQGCDWVGDYLKNPNAKVDESDRTLCDDIPTHK
jgi:WD40 repeat protein/tetratricopeptide (TPR) repeat protein